MQLSVSSSTFPRTTPLDMTAKGKNPPPKQNKDSKPHSQDIKLENFTNVFDTILNKKLFGLNK